MPLVESARAAFPLLRRDVRWKVEIFVVNTLDLKIWREAIMLLRKWSPTKNVDLRLYRNGRPLWDTIDLNSIVRCQERVCTMCKATGSLVRIKARTISILCKQQRAISAHLDVSRYCCWGLSICGCSLNTNILCLCSASEMNSKSASVKLFRSIP